MKPFSNKNISSKLLFLAAILFACLAFLLTALGIFLPLDQQKTSKQEVSKSPAAQAAKVELSKQTAKVEAAKKPAEKSQKTEMELRKEMLLDKTVDFTIRMDAASALIEARIKEHKSHVSNTVKECAAYKRKVYANPSIDPQVKDLLWGAVIVASEYCWEVDTAKPKQKKAEPRLK